MKASGFLRVVSMHTIIFCEVVRYNCTEVSEERIASVLGGEKKTNKGITYFLARCLLRVSFTLETEA
jgi:hypothetical protein